MGEVTMNKADVKLEYSNLSALSWSEVQKVCGAAPSSSAKALYDEMMKKLKSKELKKPYAKVGLIKGSMFLRIKDGSTHLGDSLLVKNWQPPQEAKGADKPSAQEKKLADDFIEERKELKKTIEQGKTYVKTLMGQVAALRDRVDAALKAAQSGKGGSESQAEAVKLTIGANKLAKQARDKLTKDMFPPFEKHRGISVPKGVREELIAGYGKNYYLAIGTDYRKADEYLKMIDADLKHMADVEKAIGKIGWGQSGSDGQADELDRAVLELRDELKEMKANLLGTKTIDRLAHNLKGDREEVIKELKAGQSKIALGRADGATTKMQKAASNFKLMQKHHDKLLKLAAESAKLAKSLKANDSLKQINAEVKAAKSFADEQAKYMKDGVAEYALLKKALSAKQAA